MSSTNSFPLAGCGPIEKDSQGRPVVPRAKLRLCRHCDENCQVILKKNKRIIVRFSDLSKDPTPVEEVK